MSSLDVFVILIAALGVFFHFLSGEHWHGPTFCLIRHESIDLGHGTVESDDIELLMIGNVEEQVLTHNGQTNEAKISTGSDPRRSADIDAGQTGATVSPEFSSTWFGIGREVLRVVCSWRRYEYQRTSDGYVGLMRGRPDEGSGGMDLHCFVRHVGCFCFFDLLLCICVCRLGEIEVELIDV